MVGIPEWAREASSEYFTEEGYQLFHEGISRAKARGDLYSQGSSHRSQR